MTDQEIIDNLVSAFNDSFISMFFPNIMTVAGQALLEELAKYVLACYRDVFTNCPKIWEAFAVHKIALILLNWPIAVTDEGTDGTVEITMPNNDTSDVQLYLKSRTIGGKKCEWAEYKNMANAPKTAAGDWQAKVDDLYGKCKASMGDIFMGGGSNWPDCIDDCGCDPKSKTYKW